MSTNDTNTARIVRGTYGSLFTPCRIFVVDGWYAVEGSANVNWTHDDELTNGVDIETLQDFDCFTWPGGVDSLDELIYAVRA